MQVHFLGFKKTPTDSSNVECFPAGCTESQALMQLASFQEFGANEICPLFTRALVRPTVMSGDQTSEGLEALHRLVHNFDQTVCKLANEAADIK